MNENARKCTIGETLLTNQQQAAIEMLVLGKAIGEISRSLDVAPCTLYRWRQDDAFRSALQTRRDQFWDGAADRLKDLVHPSLEVMAEHLADEYDQARFRAASTVLRLAGNRKVFASRDADAD